jgi:hypothetical protein
MLLQLRGWLRSLRRSLGTPRGLLLILAGMFVCCGWLSALVVRPSSSAGPDREFLERFGPFGLAASCLLSLVFSSSARAVSFTPAEVDLLFPGPFTRRQLLAYKLAGIVGGSLLSTLFISLFVQGYATWFMAAFTGLALALLFMQFFSTAVTLLANTVSARAFSRGRKVALVIALLLIAAAAAQAWRNTPAGAPEELFNRMEGSAVWQAVRVPLSWFVDTYLAERFWPDLVQWGGRALAVDLGLLLLVFALDAQFLEASAAASERLYARLQQLRSGQATLTGPSPAGRVRLRLPMPPWCGGAGPILWRQWTTAARSYLLLLLLVAFLALTVVPVLAGADESEDGPAMGWVLAALVAGLPVFLTPAVVCDFRGDLDRMDVLKSLPVAPCGLALGQVLAPALLVCFMQGIAVTVAQLLLGRLEPILVATPVLALPINGVLFGLENLLFLLFPARVFGPAPGDFQATGRQVVLLLGKAVGLMSIAFLAGMASLLAYLVSRSMVATLTVAWLVLAGACASLVPLVAVAFKRFDVTRDTPP